MKLPRSKEWRVGKNWMLGYGWWGWKCWRYFRHQYGITAVGPITFFWGIASGRGVRTGEPI